MKKICTNGLIIPILLFAFTCSSYAQLITAPDGGNKKASVSEVVGITDVAIHYSRPGVKKRDGHIWGQLIPPGYTDQGFGSSKAAPWRAGANENTTIEFSTDVKIEGQPLAAGKYGFFVAYGPDECTLIFSRNSSSWGSFYYEPAEDALRVKVKPVAADKSVEWLKYEFTDQTPTSATVALEWEKLVIPFKIEVDLKGTQLASFRRELRSEKGFTWEPWYQAALWCVQNKTNLDQALLWADTATSVTFGGNQNFQAWRVKAMVLDSLGRGTEAMAAMKKGLVFADATQVYRYAVSLVANKKDKDAFELFKMNYDKHPDEFITNAGMARAWSSTGDYKKALPFAQKALGQAPDERNKTVMTGYVKKLQDGKDINH